MTPYSVGAFLLVLLLAGLAALLTACIVRWARHLLARDRPVALVALAATALATSNTLVPRSCGLGPLYRPALALVGSACAGSARVQVALVALVAVVGTVAVEVAGRGRRRPDASPDAHR